MATTTTLRVALVTGANKGLGLETCRQLAQRDLKVILTSRDEHRGQEAAAQLSREGLEVVYHPLVVDDEASVARLHDFVIQSLGRLDVLVNNAGILLDREVGILDLDLDRIRRTLETNVYAPLRLAQMFVPLMLQQGYGRVVNVSSGLGQLTSMEGGYPAYRISKAALNAVTRILAAEVADRNILVNSVCPGWVKTDMGGAGAERTPEEGAETIVWLATLPDGGPNGGFFRDRQPIPW